VDTGCAVGIVRKQRGQLHGQAIGQILFQPTVRVRQQNVDVSAQFDHVNSQSNGSPNSRLRAHKSVCGLPSRSSSCGALDWMQ